MALPSRDESPVEKLEECIWCPDPQDPRPECHPNGDPFHHGEACFESRRGKGIAERHKRDQDKPFQIDPDLGGES